MDEEYSPKVKQVIVDYEQTIAAERIARETDLEYLRRTRPDMTDDRRVAYLLWSIVAGKRVK